MTLATFIAACNAAAAYEIDHATFVDKLQAALGSTDPIAPDDCIALDMPIGSTVGDAAARILAVYDGDEARVAAAGRIG